MKDTCIRIPADLHELLVDQAAFEDRSQRAVLARALEMYLTNQAGRGDTGKKATPKKKTRAA